MSGIPLGNVATIGDQESDVSTFEVVGLGVAMAHAPRTVVEEARYVIIVPRLVCLGNMVASHYHFRKAS